MPRSVAGEPRQPGGRAGRGPALTCTGAYWALASDYDGTLADDGRVAEPTLSALRRLGAAGWRVLLVTGRHLDDLLRVFPGVAVCDLVVAENGGLLYAPGTGAERALAEPPAPGFLEELRRRGVAFSVGRTVVATTTAHESALRDAIGLLGVDLELAFNKGAVMVLPRGVDKRSGLLAALEEIGLTPDRVVAVGDGENDLPFMKLCGCSVALANGVPELRASADLVTSAGNGQGVRELIARLLRPELPEPLFGT
jgi:hydroxymethylpyrimidine pyrophosphatase-like HAD family hydrolase